jgi:GNAT superfamily N-acetyltransferase
MVTVIEAESPENFKQARALFQEYADELGIDLAFQHFDHELASLPGWYAKPLGRLLLAIEDGEAVGCAGLHPLEDEICEMKRLYVRDHHRGTGIGRALATAIVDEARKIGYRRMRLDTLESMTEATGLYLSLGFKPTSAYRHNPIDGATFLELVLHHGSDHRAASAPSVLS